MKKVLLSIMALGTAVFLVRCTVGPLAGGGTESTNGLIIGTLVDGDGAPAMHARVMLVAHDHDPVEDGPVPDSMTGTTGVSGAFSLRVAHGGKFNIEAYQPGSGGRALLTGIIVNQHDTVYLPVNEIKKTGAIKLVSMAGKGGYVYIPGTSHFAPIKDGKALIDSVPDGFIPSILYTGNEGSARDSVIAAAFSVSAGDTAVVANASVWKFSKQCRLNTTRSGAGVPGTVTNFPVLVRLTSGNFDFSQARADGGDLRFVKAYGTPLPYEIERWDPVNGLAEVWVKVDTVNGNDSTQSFLMYWGTSASSVTSISNSQAVFDTANGFAGVWHLGRPTGSIIPDATANGNNGTATSTATVSGAAGMAQSFDGTSSLVRTSGPNMDKLNFQENGTYSVSAWVRTNVLDSVFHGIMYKSNEQYGLQMRPKNTWEFCTYIDKNGWEMSRASVTDLSWHALVGVRNGTRQYLYVDGVCLDTAVAVLTSNLAWVTDQPLEIGHCPDGGTNPDRFFNGVIDEVRISRTAYNADWIKLCYMNQKEQDALLKWQ